jgi:RNA polymerase sigma-70 factor (ECF subfamily)
MDSPMGKAGVERDATAEAFDQGRAAWPEVTVETDRFAAHVARLPEAEELHADLYLACACADGDPTALRVVDRQILGEVGLFVRRIDASPELAEEVRQALRERLLVARPGETPRIADYSGRGPLGAWVRVAAVRLAIDLRRKRGEAPLPDPAAAPADELDPEAALLRARHHEDYQAALREALATLSAKERNLLRMHFVDGLTVERIGVVYQVNKGTVSRWIQAVRQKLLDETYRGLGERLRLSPSELASLTAMVQSQLHVSLSGILKS